MNLFGSTLINITKNTTTEKKSHSPLHVKNNHRWAWWCLPLILVHGKQRQGEFMGCLVYQVISRTTRAKQRELVSFLPCQRWTLWSCSMTLKKFCMYLFCMCVFVYRHIHAVLDTWKSEDNLWEFLFHCWVTGVELRCSRLSGKHLLSTESSGWFYSMIFFCRLGLHILLWDFIDLLKSIFLTNIPSTNT